MNLSFFFKLSLLSIIVPLIILFPNSQKKPIHSVFLWKNQQNFKESDKKLLDSLKISHFFVRYADIEWNPIYQRSEPIKGVKFNYNNIIPENISPVIFITNEVLLHSPPENIYALAKNISELYQFRHQELAEDFALRKIYETKKINRYDYKERQNKTDSLSQIWIKNNNILLIDCDWSTSTKKPYFNLLQKLQKLLPNIEIQSSLRLWQYRDYKLAGIPPVDRCLLMCYSTGNPKDANIKNAIVDYRSIQKYITHSKYPLELDIALPVYSWASIFRNNKFIGILSPFSFENLKMNPKIYKQQDSTTYILNCDTVMGNTYFRYGDELHYQGVNIKELLQIAEHINKTIKIGKDDKISLFSYNTIYFNQLGHENILKVYRVFD